MAAKTVEHFIAGKKVRYYFDADFSRLDQFVDREGAIIITDEHIAQFYADKLAGWKTIVIKAGEQFKQQATVDGIINQLIAFGADRNSFIVGLGGGVVTDITGYAASIYMRGVKFGFVPTTILAMVDAAIGGKNGVDVGIYKNLVGVIRQPEFLLFDYSLLESLPSEQWVNGFAEVIKHAAIRDDLLFQHLEKASLETFQHDREQMAMLVETNVAIKTAVVINDQFEQGERKLLNFGHTLGHAIENTYGLLHGHAVSIGMVAASAISVEVNGFDPQEKERLVDLIKRYGLPAYYDAAPDKIWEVLKMDKKKAGSEMNFVLLSKIGEAVIQPIPMNKLQKLITQIL